MTETQNITEHKPVKICHISDFHLPLEGRFPPYKLFSKRILGYANLKFLRAKTHQLAPFLKIMEQIEQNNPDILVATGDLVNLALDDEYRNIAGIFKKHNFSKDNLMLVPGNHDRYTPGSQYKAYFEKSFSKWLDCNGTPPCYPVFTDLGQVGIIGLDTAVWRGPVSAAGKITAYQLTKLESLLNSECAGKRPVIAMHHPPYKLLGSHLKHYLSGLYGYRKVLELLKGRNAIVIHGHIHIRTNLKIDDTQIIGVPSASNNHASHHKKMSFHTLDFDKNGYCKVSSSIYHAGEDRFETIEL
jgi:3',5'-cyclic AMP phosphodiesterase CpdA